MSSLGLREKVFEGFIQHFVTLLKFVTKGLDGVGV